MNTTLIDGIFLQIESDPAITNVFELAISRWDLFLKIQEHKLDRIFLDLLEGPQKEKTFRSFASKMWTNEQKRFIYEKQFFPNKAHFSIAIPSKGLLRTLPPFSVTRELKASKVRVWRKDDLRSVLAEVYPLTRRSFREYITKLEPETRIHVATILHNTKHTFPISTNLNEYRRIPRDELINMIYASGVKSADLPENVQLLLKNEKGITIYEYSHLELDYPLTPENFPYVTYTEAQALIKNQYKTQKEFRLSYKLGKVLKVVPNVAGLIYKESWKSWDDFLGVQPINKPTKKQWLSFEEASQLIREAQYKSREDFRKAYLEGIISCEIPPHPHRTYREKWKGYDDFLGVLKEEKVRAPKLQDYISFKEAKEITKVMNMNTRKEFYEARRKGLIPKKVPREPKIIYKDLWTSWEDFLGVSKTLKKEKWLPYEECKKIVLEANIKSRQEYLKSRDKGVIPVNTPSHPAVTYKHKWISWDNFLGIQIIKRSLLSFEEARNLVHKLKINTRAEFWKALQDGNLPRTIPSQPEIKYKSQWKGWKDFLNSKPVSKFLSYDEAKCFIEKFHFKNKSDYAKWVKLSKVRFLPANPPKSYGIDWKGWSDFMSRKSKEFLSFEDAKAFVQSLKLRNREDFWYRCKSSLMPLKIPKAPEYYYRKEWSGWGDFLSCREKVPFLSFENAKIFVQKLNLTSREQFKSLCRSGAIPNTIPRNPARTYKNEWKGWRDFIRGL